MAAATALEKIRPEAKTTVPIFIGLLSDEGAISALGGIGPDAKPAIPALMEALKDRHTRRAAAEALGKIGPSAIPALMKFIKDKDGDVQGNGAEALKK